MIMYGKICERATFSNFESVIKKTKFRNFWDVLVIQWIFLCIIELRSPFLSLKIKIEDFCPFLRSLNELIFLAENAQIEEGKFISSVKQFF